MPMQEGIKRAKTPLYALLLPVCLPGWHYGIIAAKQLLYRDYGQDDTQAKPAPVPMADYIKSLRDYDIIAAKQLLYQDYGQDDTQAKPAAVRMSG